MNAREGYRAAPGGTRCPGVYFEEIFPPPAPALRSGVPVFVGFVAGGHRHDRATLPWHALTRWDQFGARVGRAPAHGFLAYAVRGFFENGGTQCFVLPVPLPEGNPARLADELHKVFSPGSILEDLDEADLVCVPDVAMTAAERSGGSAARELQRAVLEACQRMNDRFAILDAIAVARETGSARQDRAKVTLDTVLDQSRMLASSAGALYFPWLRVAPLHAREAAAVFGYAPRGESAIGCRDAAAGSEGFGIRVPPCGHVAGVYARSDDRHGVHKAPANERLEGAIDLDIDLSGMEQGHLNAAGINCIRHFPGRGMRVWGARTLSRRPAWCYVNVRRVFLGLTRWSGQNLRDLVFEPNAPALWRRVRDRLEAYCTELFRSGALQGAAPEEAFFIKCDAETNPPEEREAGRLIAEIGLAVEVPAEFVVVRITQSVAGLPVAGPGFVP